MIEIKDIIPITISIVALFVSIISIYVSRFRPGKLYLTAGEHIHISHDPTGSVKFILPMNVANSGSRHLTIDRVALLIQDRGNPEGYLLEPAFYLALAESGDFKYDSLSVPITIFGGENITKQVMFNSSIERPTEFQMTKAGTYDLTLLAWLHGSTKPQKSEFFSVVVSEEHIVNLRRYIEEKKSSSVKLRQSKWRAWDAHPCKETEVKDINKSAIL
ncbi:MAG: hypothetical protein Q7T53_01850 [Deltaproteobacteria bacterium]|nr:hypothetical protein [Deltaproteobacteria bacterium]